MIMVCSRAIYQCSSWKAVVILTSRSKSTGPVRQQLHRSKAKVPLRTNACPHIEDIEEVTKLLTKLIDSSPYFPISHFPYYQ